MRIGEQLVERTPGRRSREALAFTEGELTTRAVVGDACFGRGWNRQRRRATQEPTETQEARLLGALSQTSDERFFREAREEQRQGKHRFARAGIGALARLAHAFELE